MALLVGVVGCAGDPSTPVASSRSIWPFSMFAKKSEPGLPVSAAPDYNKTYEQYRQEHAQRQVVSPALGLESKAEPGALQKISQAVSNSAVGRGVASVFKRTSAKVEEAVAPEVEPAPDAVSLVGETKKPSANVHLALARLQERTGNPEAAQQQYEKALEAAPDDLGALLGLARLHDRQGKFAEAIRRYQQAAEAHPDSAGTYNDLGLCHARQGNLEESVAALLRAIELQPERKLYRNNIATVLVESNRIDEAFEHLAAVHGQAAAHYNVGFLLNKRGQTEPALEQFTLAVQLDPSFKEAQQWVDVLKTKQPVERPAGESVTIPNTIDTTPLPCLTPVAPASDDAPVPGFRDEGDPTASASPESGYPSTQATDAGLKWQPSGRLADQIASRRLNHRVESSASQLPPTPEEVPTYMGGGALKETSPLDLRPLPPVAPGHYPRSRY